MASALSLFAACLLVLRVSTALQFSDGSNIYIAATNGAEPSARTIKAGYIKGSAVFDNGTFATFSPDATLQEFYNANNFTVGLWFKRTGSTVPASLIKIGSSIDLRVVSNAASTTVELAAFGTLITVTCSVTGTWSHITLEYDRSRSSGEMYLWCSPVVNSQRYSTPPSVSPNRVSFGGAALTFNSPILTVGQGVTTGELYVAQGELYNRYLSSSDVMLIEQGLALETSVNASVIVQALNKTHLQGFTGDSLTPFVTPITLAGFSAEIEDSPLQLVCPANGCAYYDDPSADCSSTGTSICGETVPCFRCESGDQCVKQGTDRPLTCETCGTCESLGLLNSGFDGCGNPIECPYRCAANQYGCNGACYDQPHVLCEGSPSPSQGNQHYCIRSSYCTDYNYTCGTVCSNGFFSDAYSVNDISCGTCSTGQWCADGFCY